MATVTKGRTFVSGETVTPTKLNELVDVATVTSIVDADVSASAAIALSKLATGALPTAITVASANLVDGTIVNADISASAAIAGSKLADAGITASKLDGAQSGSAPIYGCRAWVNFNGTKDTTGAASTANTNRLIRASGNVASVLRNGTGDYSITFTTAMPNANYAVMATCETGGGSAVISVNIVGTDNNGQSTTVVRVALGYTNINNTFATLDRQAVHVCVIG